MSMIKDAAYWQAWEAEYIRSQPVDYRQNLKVFDALYEYARKMGAFPPRDPLEGLETKIRMAQVLNGRAPSGTDRARP